MAGGSLTITVDDNRMFGLVAQRVLCQLTDVNRPKARTTTAANGRLALVLDEAIFPANLRLKPGGTDLVAGYVAGTKIVANAAPASTVAMMPFTGAAGACAGDTNRIAINAIALNVGSNPRAVTIDYANGAGLGAVNVDWGDGTTTLGAAESNAALAHTYPDVGTYTITIRDASAPVDATAVQFVIVLPAAV
jgi:hypothetical protein